MNTSAIKTDFNLLRSLTDPNDRSVIVWLFNIGAEKYWHPQTTGVADATEESIVARVEEMNLLLCREQDIIFLHKFPDPEFLSYLTDIGFRIPRILVPRDSSIVRPIAEKVLEDESLQEQLDRLTKDSDELYFVPYAVTKIEEQIAQAFRLRLVGPSSELAARVNDKIFNRQIAEELEFSTSQGFVCNNVQEIQDAYFKLRNEPPYFRKHIVKEPFGASGKGLTLIEEESNLKSFLRRLERLTRNQSDRSWIVEGWYEKIADVNYQVSISSSGEVTVFSIKSQLLDGTVYIGSRIPADLDSVFNEQYIQFGQKIGSYLFKLGYVGLASIDSIITSERTIVPIIEINGRFTLSTYLSFLGRILQSATTLSRYDRMITSQIYSHSDIVKLLRQHGLQYSKETNSGIIVYTSATLPQTQIEGTSLYLGRMFSLIVGETWKQVEEINEQWSNVLKDITKKN